MPTALATLPLASTIAATRPNAISAQYATEVKPRTTPARGAAATAIAAVETVPPTNEPMAVTASERRPGAALPGHGVAIQAGDDRSGLARHVQQDRGGRAAVLRAMENAGQQDQRGFGRHAEGQRQQQRDGGDRPQTRQHARQRADQHAQEAEAEIDRRERHAEAKPQAAQQVLHALRPPRAQTQRGQARPRLAPRRCCASCAGWRTGSARRC
jgi:hypothetical protein